MVSMFCPFRFLNENRLSFCVQEKLSASSKGLMEGISKLVLLSSTTNCGSTGHRMQQASYDSLRIPGQGVNWLNSKVPNKMSEMTTRFVIHFDCSHRICSSRTAVSESIQNTSTPGTRNTSTPPHLWSWKAACLSMAIELHMSRSKLGGEISSSVVKTCCHRKALKRTNIHMQTGS